MTDLSKHLVYESYFHKHAFKLAEYICAYERGPLSPGAALAQGTTIELGPETYPIN